jgi:hypothetical protein
VIVAVMVVVDDKGNVLAINAISFAPSATGLWLMGNEVKADFAKNGLEEEGRLVHIHEPRELSDRGWESFGWVNPNETFGAKKVSKKHRYENGGFLYIRRFKSGGHKTYLYSLATSILTEETQELQTSEEDRLSYGYIAAVNRAIAAQKQNEEATNLLEMAFKPPKEDRTYKLWDFSDGARRASKVKEDLCQNLWRSFVLSAFVGLGVLMYHRVGSDWDSDPDGEAWSTTEAVYFSVVTMSTAPTPYKVSVELFLSALSVSFCLSLIH